MVTGKLPNKAVKLLPLGMGSVKAEDISKLSTLFGVSVDALVSNKEISQAETIFVRNFEKLDEADQKEVINLIRFKERLKS